MSKLRNPLGSVDQKVLSIVGDGPVTAAQVRAAHQQAFGNTTGANACVVRFDRAGRLRTASGELGSRGRLASGLDPAPRAPRAPREGKKAGVEAVKAEYDRLRALPENRFKPRGELAVMAEDNILAASSVPRAPLDPLRKTDTRVRERVIEEAKDGPISRDALRAIHEEIFGTRPENDGAAQDDWDKNFDRCVPRLRRAHLLMVGRQPREPGAPREPRAPRDPLSKTDPRVREMAVEATSEGPIDRDGLRMIHEAVYGPRPEKGASREAWDKNFNKCVPRLQKAGMILANKRGPNTGRSKVDISGKEDAKIMRESRAELSCLRKHALSVAKIDADACPIGRSKADGEAVKKQKTAALKHLDELWASALKSNSPSESIKLLSDAADLVRDKFPGNRFGYETKAAGVLSAAMGENIAAAAE